MLMDGWVLDGRADVGWMGASWMDGWMLDGWMDFRRVHGCWPRGPLVACLFARRNGNKAMGLPRGGVDWMGRHTLPSRPAHQQAQPQGIRDQHLRWLRHLPDDVDDWAQLGLPLVGLLPDCFCFNHVLVLHTYTYACVCICISVSMPYANVCVCLCRRYAYQQSYPHAYIYFYICAMCIYRERETCIYAYA